MCSVTLLLFSIYCDSNLFQILNLWYSLSHSNPPRLDSRASHCQLLTINWPLNLTLGYYSVLRTCRTLYRSLPHSFSSYISSSTPTLTRAMARCDTSCPERGPALSLSSMRRRVTSTPPRAWTVRGSPSMSCMQGPSTDGRTARLRQSQSSSSRFRMSMTTLQHSLMDRSQPLCLRCLMLVRHAFKTQTVNWTAKSSWKLENNQLSAFADTK